MNYLKKIIDFSGEKIEAIDITAVTPEEAISWLEQLVPYLIELSKKLAVVIVFVLIANKFFSIFGPVFFII